MPVDKDSRRSLLYSLLGDLPDREYPISATKVGQEQRDSFVLETLMLDLNGIEPVPAFFIRPNGPAARRPTVIYNHAHGGAFEIGKKELLEYRPGIQSPPYAQVLSGMGYNAICIDCWNFGERRGRTESELFKEMLWKGQVLWGMMLYDTIRAVDYVVSRPDVDGSRLATMGISLGSTMAWWLAAMDERIKVCVDICCLTDFQALIETRGLDGHGIYYYVPGLLKHCTAADINAAYCASGPSESGGQLRPPDPAFRPGPH